MLMRNVVALKSDGSELPREAKENLFAFLKASGSWAAPEVKLLQCWKMEVPIALESQRAWPAEPLYLIAIKSGEDKEILYWDGQQWPSLRALYGDLLRLVAYD